MGASEPTLRYLREIIMEYSANSIGTERNPQFALRLESVMRAAGTADLDALVARLRSRTEPAGAFRAICEAMLIGETSFFRDRQPFELLRTRVLPRLIEQRRATRRLRLWSAASSTGQEAYSLAMLLCEHFPELAQWDVRILGSDVSQRARDYADEGVYNRVEVNRGLPARLLVKYFTREGEAWRVKPVLRRLTEFRVANLCGQLPAERFDLVLLRNVLLYFAAQQRREVLERVHARMLPGGVLLLGNSELADDSNALFAPELEAGCLLYTPAVQQAA